MTRVIYSPEAEAELVEIAEYIARRSEHYAEAYVVRLRKKAADVSRRPRACRRRDDLAPGLRSAILGNHLIIFRIVAEGIEVARVVHSARNLKSLFDVKP